MSPAEKEEFIEKLRARYLKATLIKNTLAAYDVVLRDMRDSDTGAETWDVEHRMMYWHVQANDNDRFLQTLSDR